MVYCKHEPEPEPETEYQKHLLLLIFVHVSSDVKSEHSLFIVPHSLSLIKSHFFSDGGLLLSLSVQVFALYTQLESTSAQILLSELN